MNLLPYAVRELTELGLDRMAELAVAAEAGHIDIHAVLHRDHQLVPSQDCLGDQPVVYRFQEHPPRPSAIHPQMWPRIAGVKAVRLHHRHEGRPRWNAPRVMVPAHERGPHCFDDISEVFAPGELADTVASRRRAAVLHPDALDSRPSPTPTSFGR